MEVGARSAVAASTTGAMTELPPSAAVHFDPRDTGKIFVGTHSAGVFVARRGSDAAATK